MTKSVTTSYISIWDADIIPDKKAVIECMRQLRSQKADITLPYNGICYDIAQSIKSLYFKRKDIRILYRHKSKMDLLYHRALVGGAILMNRMKYIQAGKENEIHYGWGNDDFDRYYRFFGLNYKIYRSSKSLFHLSHSRGNNSQFRSKISERISAAECTLIESCSKNEIDKQYNIPEAEKVIE